MSDFGRPETHRPPPRLVLVHDWLTGMRGGEKCLEPACVRWPDARLVTLLHLPGAVSPAIERLRPEASALNRLPGVRRYYRYLLPVMPLFAARKLPACDAVVSFSHCVAKAVVPPAGVPHVCYCFSPMRYAWHLRDAYFRRGPLGRLKAAALDVVLGRLRAWDRRTAARVTHFVAISRTVQARIRECYGRDSVVICPPVDTDFYTPDPVPKPREEFYLVVSALAPYKRFDLALDACAALGRRLVVIGGGQDEAALRRRAGPTVTFLGRQPDAVLRDHYRRCRALLFPGEEDFGIVPVEAQACGAPVVALGKGGTAETVTPATGVFIAAQTVEATVAAIEEFERRADTFDPAAARANALQYRRERYEAELFGYVEAVLAGRHPPSPPL